MKFGLLKYNTTNIGDEIQSIAAKRFLPRIDFYIDRDNINNFSTKEKSKIILNGWYMHKPENWPPRDKNLKPLFISFHISENSNEKLAKMTDSESINYYKHNEPIGCRDLSTLEILRGKGVKSYFSGCITLTLENKFKKRKGHIYIVDVDSGIKKIIPQGLKKKVKYLTHIYNKKYTKYRPFRFWLAQRLLNKYAQAKLVITSRLHCALPCLAFGTPVIFINNNLGDKRFLGLKDLLRCYSTKDLREGRVKINWETPENNPVDITRIREDIISKCNNFIKNE